MVIESNYRGGYHLKKNSRILIGLIFFSMMLTTGCGSASEEVSGNTVDVVEEKETKTMESEESLKDTYLEKLNQTKEKADALEATDSSTYALKKVENDRWELWDDLLNDIYGALKEQLPTNEMEQLREEQRTWIQHRDDSALKASEKFKGGTQEQLEYVAVLANLTEERCYTLVEMYMK